jgi:hypothetical protein
LPLDDCTVNVYSFIFESFGTGLHSLSLTEVTLLMETLVTTGGGTEQLEQPPAEKKMV